MNRPNHTPIGLGLALLTLLAACSHDDGSAPAATSPAAMPPNPAQETLRTTSARLIDDGTNDPLVVAWANATREERHALADAWYERGYGPPPADAIRVVVTSLDDSGPGTLREALANAVDGTDIVFDTDLFRADAPGVIRVATPLMMQGPFFIVDVPGPQTRRVAVIAPAPGAVVVDGDFDDDGEPDTQIFNLAPPSSFYTQPTLVGLELRNGTAENGGAAIDAGGKLVLIDVWAHSNRVVAAEALAEICGSPTVAISLGGAIQVSTPGAVIFRSVISDNTSNCVGGGIVFGRGGALLESVVANNEADGAGGGVYVWQSAPGVLLFDATTIAHNRAGASGGAIGITSRFNTFRQTALVGNEAPVFANVPREINRFERSFIDVETLPSTVQVLSAVGFGEAPRVSDLVLQGGPWPTVVPEFCSPLIDEADPADPNPRDLRGVPRPFDLGLPSPAQNLNDIGATETQSAFPPCLLAAPVLTGDATVGGTVTASPVRWRHVYGATPEGTWYLCPATGPIDDDACSVRADSPLGTSLVLTLSDGGQRIVYAERLENGIGAEQTFSNGLLVAVPLPEVDGDLRIVGDFERCGELSFELPTLVDIAVPNVTEIEWTRCFGEVCAVVGTGSTYALTVDDVGATFSVRVRITIAPGTFVDLEVGAEPTVADVPPPTCTLTEIAFLPDTFAPRASGVVETSGACEVAGVEFSFDMGGGQPLNVPISVEESGAIEGPVPTVPSESDPNSGRLTCIVQDTGGGESSSDWTYPLDNPCSDFGPCDPVSGRCATFEPDDSPCIYTEDGEINKSDPITIEPGDDACNVPICAAGECVLFVPPCDDGNACTADTCDSVTGCVHTPDVGALCNDGDLCSTGATCTAAATCEGGTPVVCLHDEGPCRTGVCNPADGSCGVIDVADETPCTDGASCIVDDEGTCEAGTCVLPDGAEPCDDLEPLPCEVAICDPDEGCLLVMAQDGTPCTTETICEGACEAGVCDGGVPIACTPEDDCVVGRCDLDTAECVFEADPACEIVDEDPLGDVGVPDAGTPDTSVPDADAPDTSAPDTSAPDTADTSSPDAPQPDTDEAEVDEPEAEYLAGSGLVACSATPGQRVPVPWIPTLCALLALVRPLRRRRGRAALSLACHKNVVTL